MPAFSWNEAETEQLTTLFREGLSFSQIASALGTKTKNSCVSKSKRIGLPQRGQIIACARTTCHVDFSDHPVGAKKSTLGPPVKHSPRPRTPVDKTSKNSAQVAQAPKMPVPAVDSQDWRCSLYDLKDRSCRYPLWEMLEDERLYCGKPTARLSEGRPYCAAHATLTYHTRP